MKYDENNMMVWFQVWNKNWNHFYLNIGNWDRSKYEYIEICMKDVDWQISSKVMKYYFYSFTLCFLNPLLFKFIKWFLFIYHGLVELSTYHLCCQNLMLFCMHRVKKSCTQYIHLYKLSITFKKFNK